MPSPYQTSASQIARFPFASRTSAAATAPLFYSATDDFREEDDGEEHEKEVADFYALQRSRRHFGNSLSEESEDGTEQSRGDESRDTLGAASRGIKSSWRGGRAVKGPQPPRIEVVDENEASTAESEVSRSSSGKGKGKLVDVDLASTVRDSSLDEVDPRELEDDDGEDSRPAPFQTFRNSPKQTGPKSPIRDGFLPREIDEEQALQYPIPEDPGLESVPADVSMEFQESPRHDAVWGTLFLICVASIFATSLLVFLHTSAPDKKHPLGDTIYSVLHKSFHLLAIDTLISIVVSLIWLSVLRSFVRPLVALIVIAVPVILFSFSIYPFVSSYKGSWAGNALQDRLMRWFSFIPLITSIVWVWTVWHGRRSFQKATDILEFSCRILTHSPALMLLGFATLFLIVTWTWTFLLLFTRVFLGGHRLKSATSSSLLFLIDTSTFWLGAFYILTYLWSMGVISGIQRSTTAATVSQWYFHRLSVPTPSSRLVVTASLTHATTTLFGSIALSALLTLAVRLPLLLLPRRLVGLITIFAYNCIPTPIAALTNPLTLTYAAIHSVPLGPAARGLTQLSFVSKLSPTTTLTPSTAASGGRNSNPSPGSLQPYRLAKLLLHSTRWLLTASLGMGAWVSTSRAIKLEGSSWRGSLYAWLVGLIAASIGWAVSGCIEAILGGVVDAVAVCWGSEVSVDSEGRGGRYCKEAGRVFGEER